MHGLLSNGMASFQFYPQLGLLFWKQGKVNSESQEDMPSLSIIIIKKEDMPSYSDHAAFLSYPPDPCDCNSGVRACLDSTCFQQNCLLKVNLVTIIKGKMSNRSCKLLSKFSSSPSQLIRSILLDSKPQQQSRVSWGFTESIRVLLVLFFLSNLFQRVAINLASFSFANLLEMLQ